MDAAIKILLVEDNPGDAKLLQILLQQCHMELSVDHVTTMGEAIAHAASHPCHIALLDLGLPDSSGLDTVKTLRSFFPQIPVIVLTGFDDEDFAVETLQNGAQDYLIKGKIDVEVVCRSLRYSLGRHETERKLADSIRLLNFAIDQMPVPVVLVSAKDEKLFRINTPAKHLMSTCPPAQQTEINGLDVLKYWSVYHPDGKPYSLEESPLTKAIREGVHTRNTELVLQNPEGSSWVSASASPLLDENNNVIAGILVFPDITDLKNAQLALMESEKKVHQYDRLEAVGRLAGGIAHDFNNLLTVIASFAEFGIEDLRDEDPIKSDLKQILDAANRGSSLSRQLLAFSKKQMMEPEFIDVNVLIKELEKLLQRLIGDSIELQILYDDHLTTIHADPSQIDQVIMNLAVNARDAMPMGGILKMSTSNHVLDADFMKAHPCSKEGNYIRIRVADTGTGMDADVQKRIFEPFFTTKPKDKGTGLGLSTVYGIIEQSNGFINMKSTLGQGTTFDIFLPAIEGTSRSSESRPPQRKPNQNLTILVVEDDPSVRMIAQRILNNAGHNVLVASNGGEAILECERNADCIDLILTDLIMPKMTGIELIERLKKLCPSAKAVFMSGYANEELASRGYEFSGSNLLPKPFRAKDLLVKIQKAFS
ncbi:MAG: response regulator [Deltaproteobacteria bacterium]|nr:response regulator [Deltaproteobacteria bacterium]